jgi:hypothetical protein
MATEKSRGARGSPCRTPWEEVRIRGASPLGCGTRRMAGESYAHFLACRRWGAYLATDPARCSRETELKAFERSMVKM